MANTRQPGQNRNLQIEIDDLYGDTNTELTCTLFDDEGHVLDSATVQIHDRSRSFAKRPRASLRPESCSW